MVSTPSQQGQKNVNMSTPQGQTTSYIRRTHGQTTLNIPLHQAQTTVCTPNQQEQTTIYPRTQPRSLHPSAMPMMTTERRWWSQPKVNLTTQDVLGCLDSSHSVTLEADEVWLSLDHPGNTSGSPLLRTSSTCHLQVRGRGQGMMSLLIFKVACFTKNQLVVHSRMRNRDRFVCDPTGWVAPGIELAMTSNVASVSIEINDTDVSFNLQAQFKTIPERSTYKLERRNVSQYLGTFFLLGGHFLSFPKGGACDTIF